MHEQKLVVSGLPEKTFGKGDVLLKEGDPGVEVFVIKDGEISVVSAGKELFRTDAEGTVVGEISVLLAAEHTATVVAERETTVYVIEDLVDFFQGNPEACRSIAQTLAARVANMNRHFVEIRQELKDLHARQDEKGQWRSRLVGLIEKMDAFWGQNILPGGEAKS